MKKALWCALLALVCSLAASAQPPKPVAIVTLLSGSASAAGRNVALFDWVPAGTTIEVAPKSRVVLAFADGRRFELAEKTKATINDRGVTATTGVKQLTSVSPFPAISAIPVTNDQRAAAIRVRGTKISGLYPGAGAVSLADATVLRFTPDSAATRYHVEVEDESGNTVFQAETASPTVALSAGILKPGAHYYWYVRTVDRNGPAARGEADFATLGAEQMREREALKASIANDDPSALALLAEVDRSLGLLWDARQSLEAALARANGDAALQQALERIEAQIHNN
ncbi:MAG: hypothetical protein M3Q69_07545 [Acidobacteriota bacterium]|nr:hypothetical protein [Acidobacteriota bacterium]